MRARDLFDSIIQDIEQMAGNYYDYPKSLYVTEAITSKYFLPIRELNVIMKFLLDCTADQYVKRRKLMVAYLRLVNLKEKPDFRTMDEIAEMAGFDGSPSFYKAFKRVFDMTPTDAFEKKDKSLYEPAYTWSVLSGESAPVVSEDVEWSPYDPEEERIKAKLEQSEKVLELAEKYGFSSAYSIYANKLSQKTGRSLEETFAYADSLRDYCGDNQDADSQYTDGLTREQWLAKVGDDEVNQFMFFEKGLSVSSIEELDYVFPCEKAELKRFDPALLRSFLRYYHFTSVKFEHFAKAYTFFHEHATDEYTEADFEYYLSLLEMDTPIEVAFAQVIPNYEQKEQEEWKELEMELNPLEDVQLEEDYEAFEQWAAQETDYRQDYGLYDEQEE